MRVLLTAGGTREPIDDVRVIANSSTGRLGARLADALARRGDEVVLLHGRDAALPEHGDVVCRSFGSSADLWALLDEELPRADAVLMAAAVSDYLPVKADGKLSSEADELVLRMERAPKLLDRLRERAPGAFLVGFKLTSGKSVDERVAIARKQLSRARLDLVVANEASSIGDGDHAVLLVDGSSVREASGGKQAVADALVSAIPHGHSHDREVSAP